MTLSKHLIVAITLTFAGLVALSSTGAMAHTDEYLDTQMAPNGGQLRMAGALHFELVVTRDSKDAKEKPVVVFVTDHAGTKLPTAGAKASATIISGKAKITVNLVPDGDNRLKGSGVYASTPDMKAIVSVTLPNQPAEQARFTPLAKTTQSAHEGHGK